ncbi:unnamed protein product [Dovyalis caffra]|uniref:Uncharacterized protein n=1 Tax=Dovyalis caffra TaxID=77055 RepID=A0AAV1QS23_9ROSI|nr:unnamed protein product [Dovyalis caffra]
MTIIMASSFPEKIKKKICYKGGKAIKGIEIKVLEKPLAKPIDNKAQPKKQEKPTSPEPVTGHLGLVEAYVFMVVLGQHPNSINLINRVEGQVLIARVVVVVVTDVRVTIHADVNMVMEIIPHHA